MAPADRDKALDTALAQIERQFGKGSVMRLGDEGRTPVEVIPTGAIALDVALGIGGLPRGRVVEIYGPEASGKTSLALHAVANAQRAGGIAAFIDAEHALDPEYAKKLGVDTDALLVSQPDTGEQALEIADMLIRSGALDIIVIDSVAALVPRAEIEGEMGDSHVGLQARLMSQALRKMTGGLSQSGTTAIFINQLREKIGVLFGCFSYDSRVTLADGSQEKIGKIVNQKLDVEVLSYDPETDRIVPRRVVKWFDNGTTPEFLDIFTERAGCGRGNGRARMTVTSNHLVRTPAGWREAGELRPGDRVMLAQPQRLSSFQMHVLLGGLMGDGSLSRPVGGSAGSARFRMGHGAKQVEYIDWKASLFANIEQSRSTNSKGAVFVDLTPLPELGELRSAVYLAGQKVLSWEYLKALTPLALAVWYMDDGSFTLRAKGVQERTREGSGRSEICVQALSPDSRKRLVEHLAGAFDLHPRLMVKGSREQAFLVFSKDETAKLHALVAPYVHPSMDYKLLPRLRGQFNVVPEFTSPELRLMPAAVKSIGIRPPMPNMHRFDLEIEGTHNYFVDGVMVHNSPETTTGGRALKFYASVRLDVRRIETLKDGTDAVGNRTRVKVAKNKCLAAGTRVFDPVTGIAHAIEDVVNERRQIHVMAMDKSGRLAARQVVGWFDQGEQEVLRLELRGGLNITVTPDHRLWTEHGWVEAGSLRAGDRVARPRRFGELGELRPYTDDEARMLGYLIGDGYVGGKTPITLICTAEAVQADARAIASSMGRDAHAQHGDQVQFSHRPGETNELLQLTRRAGIHGRLAWEKTIPPEFFASDLARSTVSNLVAGLLETDGHVSAEHTGAIRVGYSTTSEQLAHQLVAVLLRLGVVATVKRYDPTGKRPSIIEGREVRARRDCFEVRVSGVEQVQLLAEALPAVGPRVSALREAVKALSGRHRGSQNVYLPESLRAEVIGRIRARRTTTREVAVMLGRPASAGAAGLGQLLGTPHLRRDRVERVAQALGDERLMELLGEDVSYVAVKAIERVGRAATYDVEVEEFHTLVADGVVVHNCAPPFKQAEFDILYGHGISREGGLLDMGVEHGIVRKSGAWYTYEGDQLGQGKENSRNFLRDNPDLADEIEKRIKEKLGVGATLDQDEAEPEPAPTDF